MLRLCAVMLVFSLVAAPAWAVDKAQYYIGSRGGADLLKYPDMHAVPVAHLPRMAAIKLIETKQSWSKIQAIQSDSKAEGWVPAGVVVKRYNPAAAQNKAPAMFSGFSSWFHRNEVNQQKTAVLGVRGLEGEGQEQAESGQAGKKVPLPNDAEWVESLQVSDQDVDVFIQQGDLNP
ncbi:MAG TPA: hypothetical protein VKA31_10500 [Mariprofundaceae bacterium]|nr:hypothetical protein [Mariprofundaceae bacterium]